MHRVAVILPCRNEASTIAQVVQDFRAALPDATVHVFDNGSSDDTARLAADAGAHVHYVSLIGKGHVVRQMFADIDADLYVMADGDGTYNAAAATEMVAYAMRGQIDMVIGARIHPCAPGVFPGGHAMGNRAFSAFVSFLFGRQLTDLLSGYRVMSRRFVKSFPSLSAGFETETELTIHAVELDLPIVEVPTTYRARSAESASKLRTWIDGYRILLMILMLFKELRPFRFFSIGFVCFLALSLVLAWPIFVTYFETGLVPRFPTAIAATGCMILAILSLTSAFILDSVARSRRQMKRLFFLAIPALPQGDVLGRGGR